VTMAGGNGGIQRRGVAGAGMHGIIKAGCGGVRRSTIHNNNRDPHSSLPLLAAPSRAPVNSTPALLPACAPLLLESVLPGVAGESPVDAGRSCRREDDRLCFGM
jgi:hypothetical protein